MLHMLDVIMITMIAAFLIIVLATMIAASYWQSLQSSQVSMHLIVLCMIIKSHRLCRSILLIEFFISCNQSIYLSAAYHVIDHSIYQLCIMQSTHLSPVSYDWSICKQCVNKKNLWEKIFFRIIIITCHQSLMRADKVCFTSITSWSEC